mgnify:FL=1
MKQTTVTIEGIAPLIMHNGQLADPLNEHTQALARLTSKRKKTLDDHREIGRVEWMGGLYLDEDGAPCLPGGVIEAALVSGAKKFKLGKDAKSGLMVAGDVPLKYKGPRDAEGLWNHGGFLKRAGVRVGTARVIRSRPIFPEWSATFKIGWDPDVIKDERTVIEIVEAAGACGLCEWRPKFGRFQVS